MKKEKLTKQTKLWIELATITGDVPTFENLAVSLIRLKEKKLGDRYTTAEAQQDL